jgi:uncharacterized protein (TIGR03382 family)
MVTWVSAGVFAAALVAAWAWNGHRRRNGHIKKRPR